MQHFQTISPKCNNFRFIPLNILMSPPPPRVKSLDKVGSRDAARIRSRVDQTRPGKPSPPTRVWSSDAPVPRLRSKPNPAPERNQSQPPVSDPGSNRCSIRRSATTVTPSLLRNPELRLVHVDRKPREPT